MAVSDGAKEPVDSVAMSEKDIKIAEMKEMMQSMAKELRSDKEAGACSTFVKEAREHFEESSNVTKATEIL